MITNLLLLSQTASSAIIDCVALLVIIAFLIYGVIKGFINTFISIFGKMLSLLFAVLLCSSMAKFLNDSFGLIDTIGKWLTGIVTKIFGDTLANTTLGELGSSKLEEFSISAWLAKIIINAKDAGELPLDTTLNQIISPTLAYYMVAIISGALLYVIFRVIFFIVGDIVSKMHKIKLVGTVDRVLGAVIGFAWGVIIVQMSVFIINVIPLGFMQDFSVAINRAPITNFISKTNLFGLIVNSIIDNNLISVIKGFVAK